MTPGKNAWAARLLRTVPEPDKADKRAGATFVNILFGLVVTQIAIQLSKELVNWWGVGWVEVSETRLAHLFVALTLTALSWIGYHQSQQYPPFLIKFVNIPLFQFFLDVTMVVVYYVVVAVAENSNPLVGPVLTPSARPEAVLVFAAFFSTPCGMSRATASSPILSTASSSQRLVRRRAGSALEGKSPSGSQASRGCWRWLSGSRIQQLLASSPAATQP